MKNKLFYLIGVACLLNYTFTFTSCVNGVDDEYLDQKITTDSGKEEEGEEIPDLNGDYGKGGDYDVVMTYNGEVLDGKLVSVSTDETNETATLILSGTEVDLETAIATAIPGGGGGLIQDLGLKYVSNSPVPGVKEITIPNVTLYKNGTTYKFDGDLIQPTYTLAYKGKIDGNVMTIDIQHQLVDQKLAGTWNTAPAKAAGASTTYSPLWCDWDSNVIVSLGKVNVGITVAVDKYPFNGIFTLLTGAISGIIMNNIIGTNIQVQPLVRNMLRDITAEPNGCMFATYSYSGDFKNPQWSSDMPHTALRYYYDINEPDKKINLEVNADFLIGLIGGMQAPATRGGDPGTTKQLGRELIELLTPALKNGIPCEYVLDGNNLTINIEGVFLRNVLRKLMALANDEYAKPFIEEFITSSLGDFGPNIQLMLQTMPNALLYHDYDAATDTYSGECSYVKLGLKFVKN